MVVELDVVDSEVADWTFSDKILNKNNYNYAHTFYSQKMKKGTFKRTDTKKLCFYFFYDSSCENWQKNENKN